MPTAAQKVVLLPQNLSPGVCYANEQERFIDYARHLQGSLPINFTATIMSSSAPSPDDRDKAWLAVDGDNRILGLYTFSGGQWKQAAPTVPYLVIGEFRWYDPSLYTPSAPWYVCDGTTTGVPDLSGQFLVCTGQRAAPAAVTYTNADGTTVTRTDTNTNFGNKQTGGEETHVITAPELPGNSLLPGYKPLVNAANSYAAQEFVTNAANGGTLNLAVPLGNFNAHNNLPPYYAAALMQWRPDLA